MAHKKKNSEPELQPDETKEEPAVQPDVQPEDTSGTEIPDAVNPWPETQVIPSTITQPTVVVPVPPVIPADPAPAQKTAVVPVVPKKRIRIRPSQKKKLSVAVLCTNPITRRFI